MWSSALPLPSTTALMGSSQTMTGRPVSSRRSTSRFCEQRAAAGEDDALVDDVGRELGRRLLEREEHGLDDGVDRLGERLADLVAS